MSTTSGTFFVGMRFVAGVYTSGASFSIEGGRKTLFPRPDVPALDARGCFVDPWYRILQFIYEQKLGGDNGPTFEDVRANVVGVQDAVSAATAMIPVLTQVVETNANTAAATRETLQAAGIAGAAQIPAPVQSIN